MRQKCVQRRKKFFKETITDLSELLYFRAKLDYNLMLYKLHDVGFGLKSIEVI